MGYSVFPAAGGGVTQKVQEFTSTGTFTAPSNCSAVEVLLVAGGGGGGGARTSSNANYWCQGGGGAGGQVWTRTLTVTPGTSYTITIGSGGAGGSSPNAGANGGNSSFGGLLTATGGSGGGGFNDQAGTFANSNIFSGWNAAAPGLGQTNYSRGAMAAGGSGSSATVFSTYNGISLSSAITPNTIPNTTTYTQGTPSIAAMGSNVSQSVGISSQGVQGVYGSGGASGAGSSGDYIISVPGPYAGAGGRTTGQGLSNGQNATANFGGGGGGAMTVSDGGIITANGGNGGSGYCRITYWS